MNLDTNYKQRKEDVDAHFRCLSFIDGGESYKNLPIIDSNDGRQMYVDQLMQCCMKGQTMVVLYNMVESSICECLNYIYDAVADDGLTYAELTDEMRRMWTLSCKRANLLEKDMDEASKMPMKTKFAELAINISGSIDIRKIYDAFGKHGCIIDLDKREAYGNSFLVVKNKRNQLAHGNTSFSQCGSAYLLRDLEKIKQDIVAFITIVIEATKSFVEDKKYRR